VVRTRPPMDSEDDFFNSYTQIKTHEKPVTPQMESRAIVELEKVMQPKFLVAVLPKTREKAHELSAEISESSRDRFEFGEKLSESILVSFRDSKQHFCQHKKTDWSKLMAIMNTLPQGNASLQTCTIDDVQFLCMRLLTGTRDYVSMEALTMDARKLIGAMGRKPDESNEAYRPRVLGYLIRFIYGVATESYMRGCAQELILKMHESRVSTLESEINCLHAERSKIKFHEQVAEREGKKMTGDEAVLVAFQKSSSNLWLSPLFLAYPDKMCRVIRDTRGKDPKVFLTPFGHDQVDFLQFSEMCYCSSDTPTEILLLFLKAMRSVQEWSGNPLLELGNSVPQTSRKGPKKIDHTPLWTKALEGPYPTFCPTPYGVRFFQKKFNEDVIDELIPGHVGVCGTQVYLCTNIPVQDRDIHVRLTVGIPSMRFSLAQDVERYEISRLKGPRARVVRWMDVVPIEGFEIFRVDKGLTQGYYWVTIYTADGLMACRSFNLGNANNKMGSSFRTYVGFSDMASHNGYEVQSGTNKEYDPKLSLSGVAKDKKVKSLIPKKRKKTELQEDPPAKRRKLQPSSGSDDE